jgi:hypothetical protein
MELTRIRQNPSFLFGDFEYAIVDDNIFSFIRCAKGHPSFLVAMNLSGSEVKSNFKSNNAIPSIAKVLFYFDNNIQKESEELFKIDKYISTENIVLPSKSCLIVSW